MMKRQCAMTSEDSLMSLKQVYLPKGLFMMFQCLQGQLGGAFRNWYYMQ